MKLRPWRSPTTGIKDPAPLGSGAAASCEVTVIVIAVPLVPEWANRSLTMSTCMEKVVDRQLYRRVFVPGVVLLRENLPEPQV